MMMIFKMKITDPLIKRTESDWGGEIEVIKCLGDASAIVLAVRAKTSGDLNTLPILTNLRLSYNDTIKLAIMLTKAVARFREGVRR